MARITKEQQRAMMAKLKKSSVKESIKLEKKLAKIDLKISGLKLKRMKLAEQRSSNR